MAVAPETETTSKHVNSVKTRAQTLEEETETRFVSFPRILGLAWRLFQGGIIMPALEDANDFCTVAAKEMKTILKVGDSANVLVDEELDKSRWLATCDFRTRELQNRKQGVFVDVYIFEIDCKHTYLCCFLQGNDRINKIFMLHIKLISFSNQSFR